MRVYCEVIKMKSFRSIIRFTKRVRNRLSSYYNLLRLKMYGVKHGNHCVIYGHENEMYNVGVSLKEREGL